MPGFVIIAAAAMGAATLPVAPAAAQAGERDHAAFAPVGTHFSLSSNVRIHRRRDGRDFGRRSNREAGDLYFPYREYQGATLWGSEGFNDWWHDRPDRAYPRWIGNNQNCERLWWSGGGWRC